MANRPKHAPWVLGILLVAAAVANINMSIINVALPDIAKSLGATHSQQSLIADAFAMSLAATVLYLGAIGDRYGHRTLLLCGAAVSIPASMLAAWAPTVEALVAARILGGFGAALMFPATLSIISVLWQAAPRTRAIALWSGVSGSAAFLGSIAAGALLLRFWWGSVFLITVPAAAALLVVTKFIVPADASTSTEPVDHLGGLLSIIGVTAFVWAVANLTDADSRPTVLILLVVASGLAALFIRRQRAIPHPLVDLHLAVQRTFLVACVAGMIAFGAFIGALYIGQQYTANVLRYNAFESAATAIPAAVLFLVGSPLAGRIMADRGGRFTLLAGIACMGIGFVIIALLWQPGASVWVVLVPYAVLGAGTALAGAAFSMATMASLPPNRAGMGSSVGGLVRNFGAALIQALMAAALTIAYSHSMMASYAALPAGEAARTSRDAAEAIASSYQTAQSVAADYPPVSGHGLLHDAAVAYSTGKTYALGIAVILIAVAMFSVWRWYPGRDAERGVFAEHEGDR
jgi:MFS family permease